ncbi:MBL fold metallo-hydrolase [Mammaliicoccus sciuri]|uniref:MBL fold metallo-hydrolase n=1 Tax=Mammaliicoccus sciuri TaxID=1296 RepID=UPI002DBE2FA8|nr:MBL fold metallo-hydrolase [Mammaliicoccus sciuri]MEB7783757.1 MBL fold metallo-hydrolase [Mammaliicoccus sciuri]
MKITHIRNATSIIDYADRKFLVDPMLGEKGSFPGIPNAPREELNNPLVELPISLEEITKDIDAIILTHLHIDHFDEKAQKYLPKDIKVFVQDDNDAEEIKNVGFKDIEVLNEYTIFDGIKLIKTPGEHGRGEILETIGSVCGVIFDHPDEQKLYIAGDTVWYSEIKNIINKYKPEVIIVNGGDNQTYESSSLIMNEFDIYQVAKESPNSKIIVVHMEAVNHWNLSRNTLKQFLHEKELENQVFIPDDGESYIM